MPQTYESWRLRNNPIVPTNEIEVWRVIPILPTHSASNIGRIRKNQVSYIKRDGGICLEAAKVIYASRKKGYAICKIGGHRKYKEYPIHRLVCLAFHENPKNKPEVNHKDGDKLNNRADNLEWVTKQENKIHAINNQLVVAMQEYEVIRVRYLHSKKIFTVRMMSDIFGFDETTIAWAIKFRSHTHVLPTF